MSPSLIAAITASQHLSPEEQAALAVQAAAGDLKARGLLLETSYKLIMAAVLMVCRRADDDLFQEGVRLFFRAIETFEPFMGSFPKHARRSVQLSLPRRERALSQTVHVPEPKFEDGDRAPMSSLDAPIGEADGDTFGDMLAAPDQEEPCCFDADLSTLSRQEKAVIRLRFGFAVKPTLAATGRELGFTGQRVQQIEAAALAKLRRRAEFNRSVSGV